MKEYKLCMGIKDSNGSVTVYCGNDKFRIEILDHQVNGFCTECGYAIAITRRSNESHNRIGNA